MVDPCSSNCSTLGDYATYPGTPPESPSAQSARHKAPPVCVDISLMSFAMTTDALSELTFPPNETSSKGDVTTDPSHNASATDGLTLPPIGLSHPPSNSVVTLVGASSASAVPVSSSSSTCTRESDTLSDVEGVGHHHVVLHSQLKPSPPTQPPILPKDEAGVSKAVDVLPHHPSDHSTRSAVSTHGLSGTEAVGATPKEKYNAKVSLMKTSRQGRSSQRWLVEGGETVRLVTGCVPILRSGKILFISSSRQSEWILPKGGWEQDEAMEESAIRECFEEAGVLGTLGPPLKDVQYETRKSKKRRLEQEEIRSKRSKDDEGAAAPLHASVGDDGSLASASAPLLPPPPPPEYLCEVQVLPSPCHSPAASTTSGATPTPTQHLDWTRIRWLAQQTAPKMCSSDETASVASNVSSSTTTTHSQVRMTLFPLYVTDVHSDWPERGRLRTAVDIDQAIAMMDSRPEFRVVLQEVKARGLHLG
jgi:8-oxo-dGTP pyrophosphatase MutT (NUDIX family)